MNITAFRLIDGYYKQTQFYTYYNKVHKIIRDTTENVPKELLDYLDTYKKMIGTRNRIVHDYDRISNEILYKIATERLSDSNPHAKPKGAGDFCNSSSIFWGSFFNV